MPNLSVVVPFRDRDVPRVQNFLESLQEQSYDDFDVVLIDYGSQHDVALAVQELCSKYPFAKYHFVDSRGMYWNRSRALNIGIRKTESPLVLCTDIDLIFSKDAVKNGMYLLSNNTQVFSRVYYLPRNWTNKHLTLSEVNLPLSPEDGFGAYHLAHREHFCSVHGFDEQYKIWGFEDNDIESRLRKKGLETVWQDVTQFPVYHQWHPPASVRNKSFPMQWHKEMSFHFMHNFEQTVRNNQNWGSTVQFDKRPSRQHDVHAEVEVPVSTPYYQEHKLFTRIYNELRSNPGKVIEISCSNKEARFNLSHITINRINKVLRYANIGLEITDKTHHTLLAIHFFLLRILSDTNLVEDYSIESGKSSTSFRIVFRHERIPGETHTNK